MEKKLTAWLKQFLVFLSPDKAKIEVKQTDDKITVKLHLPQASFLIGHRGENIANIRHLIWLYLRQKESWHQKLSLDINDYLAEKENKLIDWAKAEIDKVINSGRPRSFYDLSSYERRLIHLICTDNPLVNSISEDSPRGRILTISLAKDGQEK